MGDFYPGINEPMKPLKLPMSDHKYYDENVPAFRRDDPTDAGKLWLDTKINFLNEVMKFLPRTTTNTLTKQEYSKDQVKDYGKRLEVAESVYNTDIFSDKDVGLWKGNQSTVLDQLFTDQSGSEPALSRFAGLLGVPFDGHIALGTYIVDDEDNTSRPVTFMERTENGKGTGVYYMQYTNKNGVKLDYDITDADTNYLIPIIKDLKGDSYAKNFREGVNFHATVLDFQNTNASYDNDSNQFVVDANGDGYADGVDTGTDGKIDKYDSLSTKALDTSMYQSEYLKELGVYTPVLDYSNVFSDLMSGSLFGTDTIDREYSDSDRKTYNALQNILDGKETSGEFKSFLTKIKFEVKSSDDKTMDYIPNIYELARKGIDFSDTTTWNEKDIFYLSMLMIESRRRYTYAMSTIFGVQGANPDVKDVLTKYANPDIWQCSPLEDYLYMDVCTSAGRTERMYNYFIPKDVGQNITDPTLQKIEKINWLNKRSVEYFTNDAMYTMYQDATNMALKDNKSDLLGLKIPVTSDMDVCVTDFNNMLEKTNSILQSGGKLNETQLSQMLSLFKEAKDSLLGQISSSETNLTAGVSSTALNNFLSKYPTSISLSTEVDSVALSTYVTAHSPKYAYVSATGALTVNGIIAADEATSLFAMITNTADREKINALKQQVIDLTENIASTELTKFLNDNSSKYVYASGTGKLTVLGTMTEAECNSLKGYFPAKDTNTLTGLLNLTTTLTLGVVSSGLTTFLNANSSKYAYVSATGALTVSGVMTESECNTLKGLYSSTEDKAKIDSLMASSVARQSKYEYNSATGQLIVNGTMTIEEAAALKLIFTASDISKINTLMSSATDKDSILTGSYSGTPGSEYVKRNGSKILYAASGASSAEATKWNQLNDYITKINLYAGNVLLLKDEASGKTFIDDYLNNSTDLSKATLYKIGPNNTMVEDVDSKKGVINNSVETISHYYNIYKSNIKTGGNGFATGEMEKIIDISYDVSNNTADIFSILSDNVNDQAKFFNDINSIDKFHFLQYGTVRNVNDGVDQAGKTLTKNLYEKGILDLGYYPEEIAKTSAQSPYIDPKQVPDNEAFLDGAGNARYQTNMVDKMYFSMIAEMQKMNNFYMMMMFSSPEDANSDGVVNDKTSAVLTAGINALSGSISSSTVTNLLSEIPSGSSSVTVTDQAKATSILGLLAINPTDISGGIATVANWKISLTNVTGNLEIRVAYKNKNTSEAIVMGKTFAADGHNIGVCELSNKGSMTLSDALSAITMSDNSKGSLLATFLAAYPNKYEYNSTTGKLAVNGTMTQAECNSLKLIFTADADKLELDEFMNKYTANLTSGINSTELTSFLATYSKYTYESSTGKLTVNGIMTSAERDALIGVFTSTLDKSKINGIFSKPIVGGRYSFLDPLKASADALAEDERAYLQSTGIFLENDTNKSLMSVGVLSENELADSLDVLAANVYVDLALKLTGLGVFQPGTNVDSSNKESYVIATPPTSQIALLPPYDILSAKLTKWFSGKKQGDLISIDNIKGMIAIYSTQILMEELKTKKIIDDSSYLKGTGGVAIRGEMSDLDAQIAGINLSSLSPLFINTINDSAGTPVFSSNILKDKFKDIVRGKDYVFSSNANLQTIATEKRTNVNSIVAGAVEEDYKQIKTFVSSLYTRMSDINFADSGATNNNDVVTSGFDDLDFTISNTVPDWMAGFGVGTITSEDIGNDVLKTVLENEGIIVKAKDSQGADIPNTYSILQGINPKAGLKSFEVLIRDGYTDDNGNISEFKKAGINTLVEKINHNLLGDNLWSWVNTVKNLDYNAFGSASLKVNTKDTMLSMLVSRDFVATVSEVKKYKAAEGFSWAGNSATDKFNATELNSLWSFITKNVPVNIIPGVPLPSTLTTTANGAISYQDLDMIKNVIDMLEIKWGVNESKTWTPGTAFDSVYLNAINVNSKFIESAQADWQKMTAQVAAAFNTSGGTAISFNPKLDASLATEKANFNFNYNVTYTAKYTGKDKDGKDIAGVTHRSAPIDKTTNGLTNVGNGSASVSLAAGSYVWPDSFKEGDNTYTLSTTGSSVAFSSCSFTGNSTSVNPRLGIGNYFVTDPTIATTDIMSNGTPITGQIVSKTKGKATKTGAAEIPTGNIISNTIGDIVSHSGVVLNGSIRNADGNVLATINAGKFVCSATQTVSTLNAGTVYGDDGVTIIGIINSGRLMSADGTTEIGIIAGKTLANLTADGNIACNAGETLTSINGASIVAERSVVVVGSNPEIFVTEKIVVGSISGSVVNDASGTGVGSIAANELATITSGNITYKAGETLASINGSSIVSGSTFIGSIFGSKVKDANENVIGNIAAKILATIDDCIVSLSAGENNISGGNLVNSNGVTIGSINGINVIDNLGNNMGSISGNTITENVAYSQPYLDGYKEVWANGTWGTGLAPGGYSYLSGNSKLSDEYARDFNNIANTATSLGISDYNGDGSNEAASTVYDAMLLIRDRASANMGYLNIQLDRFNKYASQVKDMLKIGAGDASNKGENSLEELFRNEFYMKGNFDPLILGSEFQSRFVEDAFVSTNGNIASNADTQSMTDSVGWYETAGRLASKPTTKSMDLAKFNYAVDTDYNTQYATVKAKMNNMKYDGSQGKDNIRSTMERALRDDFSRTLVIGDLVLTNAANLTASFRGANVQVRVYSKDGQGVKLNNNSIFKNLKDIGWISYEETDASRDVSDCVIKINTQVMKEKTYDDFYQIRGLLGLNSENDPDNVKLKQLYDFLSNIGWNNVAIGANLSSAHSIIELNSIYMEVIMARIMISITNDELNTDYERRKADYDEKIGEKRDEEVSEQIADSKRSAFKSYLKSISRKK